VAVNWNDRDEWPDKFAAYFACRLNTEWHNPPRTFHLDITCGGLQNGREVYESRVYFTRETATFYVVKQDATAFKAATHIRLSPCRKCAKQGPNAEKGTK
jgi:hypothetical protein